MLILATGLKELKGLKMCDLEKALDIKNIKSVTYNGVLIIKDGVKVGQDG